MELPEIALLFRALGHPIRIKILLALANQPLPYSKLARLIFISPYFDSGKFNYHLKYLMHAGLITQAPSESGYIYKLTTKGRKITEIIIKLA